MPSVNDMITAFASAENFADDKAVANAILQDVALRWSTKADRYQAQASALFELKKDEVDESIKHLLADLVEMS